EEMKEMLFDPEGIRASLLRVMDKAQSLLDGARTQNELQEARDILWIWRDAISARVPGIPSDATTVQVKAAVAAVGHDAAARALFHAIGQDVLDGVLGHEYLGHVLHRDPWVIAAAGSLANAITFAVYKILWGVSHAKAALGFKPAAI